MSDLTRLREVRDTVSSVRNGLGEWPVVAGDADRRDGLVVVLNRATMKLNELVSGAKRERALGDEVADKRLYLAARAPERPNWFKVPIEGDLPEAPSNADLTTAQLYLMRLWFEASEGRSLSRDALADVLMAEGVPQKGVTNDDLSDLMANDVAVSQVRQSIEDAVAYRETRVARELAARMAAVAAWPWHWADTVLAAESPPAAE